MILHEQKCMNVILYHHFWLIGDNSVLIMDHSALIAKEKKGKKKNMLNVKEK